MTARVLYQFVYHYADCSALYVYGKTMLYIKRLEGNAK